MQSKNMPQPLKTSKADFQPSKIIAPDSLPSYKHNEVYSRASSSSHLPSAASKPNSQIANSSSTDSLPSNKPNELFKSLLEQPRHPEKIDADSLIEGLMNQPANRRQCTKAEPLSSVPNDGLNVVKSNNLKKASSIRMSSPPKKEHSPKPPEATELPSPFMLTSEKSKNNSCTDHSIIRKQDPTPHENAKQDTITRSNRNNFNTLNNTIKVEPQTAYFENNIKQQNSRMVMSRGRVTEVACAGDMESLVHGTYYSRWSVAQQYGLNRGQNKHIPCLSYDPLNNQKARDVDKGYQLLIYINIEGCLAENMKILVLPGAGQVLCTGDANGKILPHLFDKVIDTASRRVIFPKSETSKSSTTSSSMFVPTQVIKHTKVGPKRSPAQGAKNSQQPSPQSAGGGRGGRAGNRQRASNYEVPVAQLVNLDEPTEQTQNSKKPQQHRVDGSDLLKEGRDVRKSHTKPKKPKQVGRLACNFNK